MFEYSDLGANYSTRHMLTPTASDAVKTNTAPYCVNVFFKEQRCKGTINLGINSFKLFNLIINVRNAANFLGEEIKLISNFASLPRRRQSLLSVILCLRGIKKGINLKGENKRRSKGKEQD